MAVALVDTNMAVIPRCAATRMDTISRPDEELLKAKSERSSS